MHYLVYLFFTSQERLNLTGHISFCFIQVTVVYIGSSQRRYVFVGAVVSAAVLAPSTFLSCFWQRLFLVQSWVWVVPTAGRL